MNPMTTVIITIKRIDIKTTTSVKCEEAAPNIIEIKY